MAISALDLRRLKWNCRRGLLENDLVLERFLDRHAASLDDERLATLNKLLDYDDNALWDLLSGRSDCADPRLQSMIVTIREA